MAEVTRDPDTFTSAEADLKARCSLFFSRASGPRLALSPPQADRFADLYVRAQRSGGSLRGEDFSDDERREWVFLYLISTGMEEEPFDPEDADEFIEIMELSDPDVLDALCDTIDLHGIDEHPADPERVSEFLGAVEEEFPTLSGLWSEYGLSLEQYLSLAEFEDTGVLDEKTQLLVAVARLLPPSAVQHIATVDSIDERISLIVSSLCQYSEGLLTNTESKLLELIGLIDGADIRQFPWPEILGHAQEMSSYLEALSQLCAPYLTATQCESIQNGRVQFLAHEKPFTLSIARHHYRRVLQFLEGKVENPASFLEGKGLTCPDIFF